MATSGTLTLKDIVKRALWKAELDDSKYRKLFQYAIDGYRDIRMFHGQQGIEILKATINATTQSLSFPSDLIKIIDVYVPINGEVWPLTRDTDIVRTLSGGGTSLDPDWGEGIDINRSSAYSYTTKGGTNTEGYYTVDYENRRIIFRNVKDTQVFLHYKSSGVSDDSVLIPIQYYPTMEAYMLWQNVRYRDPNLAQYYKAEYESELDKLRYFENIEALDVMRDWVYKTYSQTPLR